MMIKKQFAILLMVLIYGVSLCFARGDEVIPDFITFFCHLIADIDYQSFRCVDWVN